MCRTRTRTDYLPNRYVTVVSTHWWCNGGVENHVDVYNGPDQLVPALNGSYIKHGTRLMRLWLNYHLDEQGVGAVHERLVRHAAQCPDGAPCSHLEGDRDVLYRDQEGSLGGEPIVPQLTPEPRA